MNIEEFIELTILSIRKGVEEFNTTTLYHAHMAEEIHFDIAVDGNQQVVGQGQNIPPESITRLKFSVPIYYDPRKREEE